ncbi:hypothetical protein B0H17DRAFT_1065493 [Mycena rosella]|uniref:Uncharacterized protein n=1 Tax=Mycena rosella TaxID=1033263 RepID=A0AAD7DEX9_MYCRO|nr:hypothetical protein B0H17DRAFT_1065493 [Mycena rosella]
MSTPESAPTSAPNFGAPDPKSELEPTLASLRSKSETDIPPRPELAGLEPEFPDDGWRAWTTIAGSWLVPFSTFGCRSFIPYRPRSPDLRFSHVYAFGVFESATSCSPALGSVNCPHRLLHANISEQYHPERC